MTTIITDDIPAVREREIVATRIDARGENNRPVTVEVVTRELPGGVIEILNAEEVERCHR